MDSLRATPEAERRLMMSPPFGRLLKSGGNEVEQIYALKEAGHLLCNYMEWDHNSAMATAAAEHIVVVLLDEVP